MHKMRVIHLSARAPFARNIISDKIEILNGTDNNSDIPRDVTYAWLENFFTNSQDKAVKIFDVLHLHTVELSDFETFKRSLEKAKSLKKGILFTYHDTDPMFSSDSDDYTKRLRFLASIETEFTTLTQTARENLVSKVGISIEKIKVIPHGNVLPLDSPLWETDRKLSDKISFSIHGGFRPNKDIFTSVLNFNLGISKDSCELSILTRGVSNKEYFSSVDVQETVRLAQQASNIQLKLHPFPSDLDIAEFVSNSDVAIMPYKWGTHSGQLELAFDLGILSVITDVGAYKDQYKLLQKYVPEPHWVNWSDGAVYEYGSRILSSMQNAAENISFSPSLVQRQEFHEYRKQERSYICSEYLKAYKKSCGLNSDKHLSIKFRGPTKK